MMIFTNFFGKVKIVEGSDGHNEHNFDMMEKLPYFLITNRKQLKKQT